MSKETASNLNEIESVATLSKDPETEGFDTQAGQTWVYPTNYAIREYQYNIIQEALLKNTMVSLPTGLGKTFIAAVVMYNFYRWYPMGKIIFMAPTRPLVKQQIDACYNIMAIPKEATAELTGTKVQTYRKEIWKEKRVFFITPQVLQNDLDILTELGTKIKCLVFDEAHKAKGNHAYCEVIRKLSIQNRYFRVLSLSATPGSTLTDVLGVIHNLLISHLEIRTDDSPDVVPYVFERSLETVVVPLGGKLEQVRDRYMQVLEKYTRVLIQHRVIVGNCSTLTKGKIFLTMRDYQEKNRNGRDRSYSDIMRNLNICVTLYHAYELLIRHGLRGFLSFFEEHIDKPLLRGNTDLQSIMEDVREYLGPAPNVEPLPDGSIAEIPQSSKFGHPKFYKLRDILSQHFSDANNSGSRVIVFCEYRESVMEAYALLLRHMPLIRPKIFLGQGAITQRQQINVIKAFRQGECNTLISTCIGEEGLDVGDVDLIVCFDISNKSPVRLVQRMGRTGRKKQGRVVVLVTEGKEQQTLKECLIHKQNLTNHILQSTALYKEMYPQNPRMVPADIDPKCQKLFITVKPEPNQSFTRKKSNSLKDMFDNLNKKSDSLLFQQDCDVEILEINDKLPVKREYWNKRNLLSISCDKNKIDFSKKLGKLRVLQPTGVIGHSRNSEMLVSLLQFAESKKFNIPMTQVPVMPSQLQPLPKKMKTVSSEGLKQTDIRNMFFKSASSTELKPQDIDIQIPKQKEVKHIEDEVLNKLQTEIASYLSITIPDEVDCKICEHLFDCSQFIIPSKEFSIKSWIEPDYSIFESLTIENLNLFADSMSPKSKELYNKLNSSESKTETKAKTESELYYTDRSMGYFDDTFGFKDSPFKPPNSVQKVLKKLNLDDSIFNDVAFTQLERPTSKATEIPCTLDFKAFDDAEFTQMKTVNNTSAFTNMTALEEFFDTSCIKTPPKAQTPKSQDTIIYSPDYCYISSEKKQSSGSPILCSFDRVRQLKTKAHKRLFETSVQDQSKKQQNMSADIFDESLDHVVKPAKPNLSKLLQPNEKCTFFKSKRGSPNAAGTSTKDDYIIEEIKEVESDDETDIIDTSLENCFESIITSQAAKNEIQSKPKAQNCEDTGIDISDMIDLSIFGLDSVLKASKSKVLDISNKEDQTCTNSKKISDSEGLQNNTIQDAINNLSDFCDDSIFDMFFSDAFKENKIESNKLNSKQNRLENVNSTKQNFTINYVTVTTNQTEKFKPTSLEHKNKLVSTNQFENKKQLTSNNLTINRGQSKTDKEKENKWQDDSMWDSCSNWDQTSSQLSSLLTDKSRGAKNKFPYQLSTKRNKLEEGYVTPDQEWEKENGTNNKKQEKSPDVVDLTADSPIRQNKSPIIKSQYTPLKSQRNKILTQPRLLDYATKQNESSKTNKIEISKKTTSKLSTKTNCKLRLNKTEKNSLTSMQWFKKNTSSSSQTVVSSTSNKNNPSLSQQNSVPRIILSPVESESSENDYTFTFNTKKIKNKSEKNPRNLLSLTKVSPVLSNHTKTDQHVTTPKKSTNMSTNRFDTPRKAANVSHVDLNSSDEDFELPSKKAWIKPKPKQLENKKIKISRKKINKVKSSRNVKKKLTNCPYIELEAELSMDEHAESDSDVEEIDDDRFEESFVDDDTQNIPNNTMMQAKYLQSVKSPLLNRGKFKIPERPRAYTTNVYSQLVVDDAENAYLNDTFCVNTEDMCSQETQNMSDLELAELILEKERKNKRKKRNKSSNVNNLKRRRIIESSSDSD